ncbi:hypothetical protein JCM11491_002789 [Sporobolomyces phaffii]
MAPFLLERSASGKSVITRLEEIVSSPPGSGHAADDFVIYKAVREEGPAAQGRLNRMARLADSVNLDAPREPAGGSFESCRKLPFIPSEVVHAILKRTQEGQPYGTAARLATLKNASLVCKLWTDPARRVLFAQPLRIVSGAASIQKLQDIFFRFPELGRAVQTLDLCSSTRDVFRRFPGLVRLTPMVKNISFHQVALSDRTQRRLFNALKTIRPREASIVMGFEDEHHRATFRADRAMEDMRFLGRLLVEWKSLTSLTLSGYQDSSRPLGTNMFPGSIPPSYLLHNLTLDEVVLPDRSLLDLLGANTVNLTSLKFEGSVEVSNAVLGEAFEQLGSTLESLAFFNGDSDAAAGAYEPGILVPLVKLRQFELYSQSFSGNLLGTVLSLPSIEEVTVNPPSIGYHTAIAALYDASPTLWYLTLDWWDATDSMWEDAQRWHFAKQCAAVGIDLALNGMSFDDIKDGESEPRATSCTLHDS